MKINFKALFIMIMASTTGNFLSAQCADNANVYSFNYDEKTYEIVRENKTWFQAASCAVERGGYLAEINSESEQEIIFSTAKFSASIAPSNTTAFECGSCPFVWIGGNDMLNEGNWVWDGDGDSTGIQFWMGDVNGSPIGGLYNNWGTEPDNFNDQDAMGLALHHWISGDAGQWGDIAVSNELYFVIEYDMILGIENTKLEKGLSVFPNPVQNELTVVNQNTQSIDKIEIYSLFGRKVKTFDVFSQLSLKDIEIGELETGVYLLNVQFENGAIISKKIVKE